VIESLRIVCARSTTHGHGAWDHVSSFSRIENGLTWCPSVCRKFTPCPDQYSRSQSPPLSAAEKCPLTRDANDRSETCCSRATVSAFIHRSRLSVNNVGTSVPNSAAPSLSNGSQPVDSAARSSMPRLVRSGWQTKPGDDNCDVVQTSGRKRQIYQINACSLYRTGLTQH
jgi:hypothetical protein